MSNEPELQLPSYPADELAALSEQQLLELMIKDEDRVPLTVIEECARRGEAMERMLAAWWVDHESKAAHDASVDSWWLNIHAAMILGKMHSESSGQLLLTLMHHIGADDEQNLFDWLAGYWPMLFANKPREVIGQLKDLVDDLRISEWMRHQAIEAHVAWFDLKDDPALEDALRWVATCAAAEDDVPDFRLLIGSILLDFPRAEFRPLLEKLVGTQTERIKHFDSGDIERAYARTKLPAWRDHWKDFMIPSKSRSVRSDGKRKTKLTSTERWTVISHMKVTMSTIFHHSLLCVSYPRSAATIPVIAVAARSTRNVV
jgi:hypothetical protein